VSSEPYERLDSATDFKQYLGRKVTLRYRLHDDAAHPVSEAVGVVMSVEHQSGRQRVVILTRGSERRVVPVDDVMAGKAFPL
jgi:ribosome maturation factor RimP